VGHEVVFSTPPICAKRVHSAHWHEQRVLTKYEKRIKRDTRVFSETVLQISIKFVIEGSTKSCRVNLDVGACIT